MCPPHIFKFKDHIQHYFCKLLSLNEKEYVHVGGKRTQLASAELVLAAPTLSVLPDSRDGLPAPEAYSAPRGVRLGRASLESEETLSRPSVMSS